MTLKKTLQLVADFRAGDAATPIVLMGYYNPIYVYGVEKFLADAKAAGVDGLIVVDLPPEEDRSSACRRWRPASISSGSPRRRPTTQRLPAVLANTSGFVYYVSITGITGAAAPKPEIVGEAVARIKAPYPSACRGWIWRARRAKARRRWRRGPMAWLSARRWSRPCARLLAEGESPAAGVAQLVENLPKACVA